MIWQGHVKRSDLQEQGEHRIPGDKYLPYDESLRIPLIVRGPGVPAGRTVRGQVSNVDFAPTLLDVLGLRADVSLPGLSLLPMIDQGRRLRDAVVSTTVRGMMVRTETSKLWYDHRARDGELYDLAADPDELDNLYGVRESAELRRALFERLLHIRMEDDYRDALPTEREKRLQREVWSAYEPEVVVG